MKGSVGQSAARDGLVMACMLLRIEAPPVVGRDLDPREGRFAGGPDDRDTVPGHIAEIRTVRDFEILRHGGQREKQPGQREKEFFHCRKVLIVSGCKIRNIPQNPVPENEKAGVFRGGAGLSGPPGSVPLALGVLIHPASTTAAAKTSDRELFERNIIRRRQ